MPPTAILSDIHGNLEALEAVLADVARQTIGDVVCLGDIGSYGPNPQECIDRMMSCRLCLRGESDERPQLAVGGIGGPGASAKTSDDKVQRENERRKQFLKDLPRQIEEGDFLYVHGAPRGAEPESVFPEDVYNVRRMERVFAVVPRYAFLGHTHLPGVFTENGGFLRPEEIDFEYELGKQKALVNVGSVGQPRDGDWRACYAILEEHRVRFRRVAYDIEATIGRIR